MKIEKTGNLTVLHLKEVEYKRRKIFYLFSFLLYLVCSFFLSSIIFPLPDFNIKSALPILIIGAFIYLYFWVSYMLLKQAFSYEKLSLGEGIAILEKGSVGKSSSEIYDISKIKNLQYNYQAEPSTEHPLKGKSIDYFGFGANDKVITNMHRDESIAFEYEGKTVYFGKRLYSWDFETIYELIYQKPYLNENE